MVARSDRHMTMKEVLRQAQDEVVDINKWRVDEIYDGVFAKGAREKQAIYSPSVATYHFLKPQTRYLFKESFRRYPWQFWIEMPISLAV